MNEETIFATARQWQDGPERRAFLDQVCGKQSPLRVQIDSLLSADADAGSLLESPPALDATTNIAPEKQCASSENSEEMSLPFLSPCSLPDRIGKLGTYEVFEVIGRGGMGIVLRGLDPKLNRIVAIKVLAPEFAANAMARKRFLREAQAAAAVSHDHVVTIHAVDDDTAVPFLVMECVIGQSLQQKIDRVGALQLREILRIGMQIALGLTAAHKQGLIHRDIKPANILLENGVERVKITDFGLARATDDVGITQSGVIAGTPQYMSPEQAMGDPLDQRSDLFSLGSVLYTMCTGRPAFRAESTIAVIRRVCDDAPRAISELNPEIPDWLIAVIDRLLSKKPSDRFQTAAEVATLLEQQLAAIQTSSASSGHRAASRRRKELLRDAAPKSSRSDLIWTWVGIVTLCMALVGGGARVLSGVWKRDDQRASIGTNGQKEFVENSSPEAQTLTETEAEKTAAADLKSNLNEIFQIEKPGDKAAYTIAPLPNAPVLALAPFSSDQATKHQAAWAKYLGVPVEFSNRLGMKFQLIPPGEFLMGSTQEEMNSLLQELERLGVGEFEKFSAGSSVPQHRVRLTEPFYIGQFEVTIAQYQQFVKSSEATIQKPDGARFTWQQFVPVDQVDRYPVVGISWDEAQAFCKWLSTTESLAYDLPSEAQWEFACRGGSQSLWSFGDDVALLESHAMTGQSTTGMPAPVGLKQANPFGLYDMHGNVDEWCQDWHDRAFYGRSPLINPVLSTAPNDPASGRVSRGGSWNAQAWWSRSAMRAYDFPSKPVHPKGFRVIIQGHRK